MNRQVAVWREQGEWVGIFAQEDSTAFVRRFPGAELLPLNVVPFFLSSEPRTTADNRRKRFLVSPGPHQHGVRLLMCSAPCNLGRPLGDPGKVNQNQ